MSGNKLTFCAFFIAVVAMATTTALSLQSLSKRDDLAVAAPVLSADAEPLTCEKNLTTVQTELAKCKKGLEGMSNCTLLNDPDYVEVKNQSMLPPSQIVQAENATQCEKDLATAVIASFACLTDSFLCGFESGLEQGLTNSFGPFEGP